MAELRDYERTDVSVRGTLVAVVIGSAAIAAIGAALLLLTQHLGDEGATPAATPAPAVARDPGAPRLQVNPAADLQRLEGSAQARLETAGWVDRDRGVAHIPIERAMEMLTRQGWPEGAP